MPVKQMGDQESLATSSGYPLWELPCLLLEYQFGQAVSQTRRVAIASVCPTTRQGPYPVQTLSGTEAVLFLDQETDVIRNNIHRGLRWYSWASCPVRAQHPGPKYASHCWTIGESFLCSPGYLSDEDGI